MSGVRPESRQLRDNYAAGSVIMKFTHDYNASGVGPLAANSLSGGSRSGLEEVKRWIPATRKHRGLGESRDGESWGSRGGGESLSRKFV